MEGRDLLTAALQRLERACRDAVPPVAESLQSAEVQLEVAPAAVEVAVSVPAMGPLAVEPVEPAVTAVKPPKSYVDSRRESSPVRSTEPRPGDGFAPIEAPQSSLFGRIRDRLREVAARFGFSAP